jgi:hypothetical protein
MYRLWQSPFRGPLAALTVAAYCLIFLVVPAVASGKTEPVVAQDVVVQQQSGSSTTESGGSTDQCWQGRADGERDAKGNPAWFIAGLFCGVFGFGAAYLITPSPPASALLGKPSGYALCYTEAYQSKSKGKNAIYAGVGWLVWIVIYVGFILPSAE